MGNIRFQKPVRGYTRERANFALLPSAKRKLKRVAEKQGVSFSCMVAEAMIALHKIILEEERDLKRRQKNEAIILQYRKRA